MNRNQNHDDDDDDALSSSKKRVKTCDNGGSAPWSNLDHDVLFLVIMRLRVVDFPSFSKVCKSWRSLALSNKNIYMTSRPPMHIYVGNHNHFGSVLTNNRTKPRHTHPYRYVSRSDDKKNYCFMRDFEQRNFETILPFPSCITFFGVTCGYVMLFGDTRHDFWLVNPFTQHQLHFPAFRLHKGVYPNKAILVSSPSISKWVYIILLKLTNKISFYIEGKRGWKHVTFSVPVLDLQTFKGKIYTLHTDCCLREMRLNPNPEFILVKTKNFPKPYMRYPHMIYPEFVSSDEKLCIMDNSREALNKEVLELDFGEMKWVSQEKTKEEYAFFLSRYSAAVAAIKPELWESWADPQTLHKINYFLRRYSYRGCSDESRPGRFFDAKMWYFPHDCFKVNLLND